MLWGQLYGQTLKNKHFDKLDVVADEDGNGRFDDNVMDTTSPPRLRLVIPSGSLLYHQLPVGWLG